MESESNLVITHISLLAPSSARVTPPGTAAGALVEMESELNLMV